MLLSPFNWLRRKAAESVIAGVADALQAVTPEGEEAPPDLDALRKRLADATALKELEEAKPKKKG